MGHEIPTALLPICSPQRSVPRPTPSASSTISDGLAGRRLAGGAIADDPQRRAQAVAGYTTTAVLSSLIGATTVWQVAILRAAPGPPEGCASRPAMRFWLTSCRLPCTAGPTGSSGAMDNLGAIVGPCSPWPCRPVGVRTAIALSIIPGLIAAAAIVYAIRHAPEPNKASANRCGSASNRC